MARYHAPNTTGNGGHVRVGVDSYSYHRLFGEIRPGEDPAAARWSREAAPVLRHVAATGAEACFLETCYLPSPASLDPAAVTWDGLAVAFSWGHGWPPGTPHGLEGGRSEQGERSLHEWIDAAARCGHDVMRITAGSPATRGKEAATALIDRLTPVLRRAADRARAAGIALALENHGDLRARDLVTLLGRVKRDNLGVCLDTVNLLRVGDGWLEGTDVLAPHTLVVQMKDHAGGDPHAAGGPVCTQLGSGVGDLHGVLELLAAAGFDGPVCVELASLGPGPVDELALVEGSVAWLSSALPERDG